EGGVRAGDSAAGPNRRGQRQAAEQDCAERAPHPTSRLLGNRTAVISAALGRSPGLLPPALRWPSPPAPLPGSGRTAAICAGQRRACYGASVRPRDPPPGLLLPPLRSGKRGSLLRSFGREKHRSKLPLSAERSAAGRGA